MAQVGWVYLDNRGGQHRIGLYHGDQSGHLVIHCNLRVVQIDFSVQESKTYSFFIDDEFCEISVQRGSGGFSYDFQVNKTVDTPRNRERKEEGRQNNRYLIYMVSALVVLVLCFMFGMQQYQRWLQAQRSPGPIPLEQVSSETMLLLRTQGETTEARFFLVQGQQQKRTVFYGFSTLEGKQVSGQFPSGPSVLVLMPNGFPLMDQDAFEVRYLPNSPEMHAVDFFQPTQSTLAAYLRRAAASEHDAHPEKSDRHAQCFAEIILVARGWPSLAHLILQGQTVQENDRHNNESYLRLVRSTDIQTRVAEQCWDQ
jgi:hypothetical protein